MLARRVGVWLRVRFGVKRREPPFYAEFLHKLLQSALWARPQRLPVLLNQRRPRPALPVDWLVRAVKQS